MSDKVVTGVVRVAVINCHILALQNRVVVNDTDLLPRADDSQKYGVNCVNHLTLHAKGIRTK